MISAGGFLIDLYHTEQPSLLIHYILYPSNDALVVFIKQLSFVKLNFKEFVEILTSLHVKIFFPKILLIVITPRLKKIIWVIGVLRGTVVGD